MEREVMLCPKCDTKIKQNSNDEHYHCLCRSGLVCGVDFPNSELAERTQAQFNANGEWTGDNPFGIEAYFKRILRG